MLIIFQNCGKIKANKNAMLQKNDPEFGKNR